jgi:hypothetical protein
MRKNENGKSRKKSLLRRTTSAVKQLFARGRWLDDSAPEEVQQTQPRAPKPQPKAAKYPQRETDIPLDLIERVYTPPLTSSKASFRSDGADHQLDQEFALGHVDNEWSNEDRYTNKSGDPRIGTHHRSYEPVVEARDEERE